MRIEASLLTYSCCGIPTQIPIYAHSSVAFWACTTCGKHYKYIRVSDTIEIENLSQTTQWNYLSKYCEWCNKNGIAPLSNDTLKELFLGCDSNIDYEYTLNALFDILISGFNLTHLSMLKLTEDTIQVLIVRLKLRLELFKRIPSATNMLLAYNLIEELTLKSFAQDPKDLDTNVNKNLERFDKLKNLALDTKFIEERKVAFDRSLTIFKKLTKIEL